MGMIEKFQQDLRDGMKLEKALEKHHLTLKEAVEFCPHPLTTRGKEQKRRSRKKQPCNYVDKYVQKKGDYYYVRRRKKGKSQWGGSYNTKREAILVRDFLNENGWNIIKVNEACKKYGIKRRTK